MTAKQFGWVTFSWLLLIFLAGAVDGTFYGGSDLHNVLSMSILEFKKVPGFDVSIPFPNTKFLSSTFTLASWQFNFFSGNMRFVGWFIGLTMMGSLAWGFFTGLLPVIVNAVGQFINAIDAINPFS